MHMYGRVVVMALDSVGEDQIDDFLSRGYMPQVQSLRDQGTRCRLETEVSFPSGKMSYGATEGNWVMFQSGVSPWKSGFWDTIEYDPHRYRIWNRTRKLTYDYQEFPPWYDLGPDYRVNLFDMSASRLPEQTPGRQVLGWGGHYPFVTRGSNPPNLLDDLNRRFGKNRIYHQDNGVFWSKRYASWLLKTTLAELERREAIWLEFMEDKDCDLMMGTIGETHSVLHDLWADVDESHPVHAARDGFRDAYAKVFSRVDKLIGSVMEHLNPEDTFILMSVHGMKANSTDASCLFFLPEMLYRFNFPGKSAISPRTTGEPVPSPQLKGSHDYWFGDVWKQKTAALPLLQPILEKLPAWARLPGPHDDLSYPFFEDVSGPGSGWMPAVWYRKTWPRSRAFALPGFAEGQVRINLIGREGAGKVKASDYEQVCDEVISFLKGWTNPRSGEPVIKDIHRTRSGPDTGGPQAPDADLLVSWTDEPFDVAEHPQAGRIGPVTYSRTGGHKPGGFAFIKGPTFAGGVNLGKRDVYDLAPTIRSLLGAPLPPTCDGEVLSGVASGMETKIWS